MILISPKARHRIGRAGAVLLGFILLLGGLLRVGLSQKRIQDAITRASGMTVQFEECSVGVFGGIDLRRVTASRPQGDSLSVQSVSVRPNLWAALRGRLQFEEVRVQDVRLVRIERPKTPELSDKATGETALHSVRGSEKNTVGGCDVFQMAKKVQVTNAGLDWMKANGSVLTQLEGIDFHYEENAPGEGRGEIRVQRGMWQELLSLNSIEAKLFLTHDVLAVSECSAKCGGGNLMGSGTLQLRTPSPFKMEVSAVGVDLEQMSRELPSLRVSGRAGAQLELEGLLGSQPTWVGTGEITVSDGMFKGLALLQMLGQVFQVQELASLKARKAHSKIRIAQRKVLLEGLHIDAGDIQLTAPGEVDFKRGLSLQARISLAENMIRGKALQLFDKRFSPPDAEGRRSLAFHVLGTLDKPQTDLVERLVGDNLGEIVGGALGGVLNQFLGGMLKPRKAANSETKAEPKEGAVAKPQ